MQQGKSKTAYYTRLSVIFRRHRKSILLHVIIFIIEEDGHAEA